MKETPILMCGPMVVATMEGRKLQTRRVVKLPVKDRNGTGCEIAGCELNSMLRQEREYGAGSFLCPYGGVGDRLWVKETWAAPWGLGYKFPSGEKGIFYRADSPQGFPDDGSWKPSIHMPKTLSRITLEITDVSVERVQEISQNDARAEGCRDYSGDPREDSENAPSPRTCYQRLWDDLNSKRPGCAWKDNPFVWAITFKKL